MRYFTFCLLLLLATFQIHAQRGNFGYGGGGGSFVSKSFAPKAEFIGGEKSLKTFLHDNTHINQKDVAQARKYVWVEFLVGTSGNLSHIEIAKSSGNKIIDTEIIRVIHLMSKGMWQPRISEGHIVSTEYSMPIRLK